MQKVLLSERVQDIGTCIITVDKVIMQFQNYSQLSFHEISKIELSNRMIVIFIVVFH